MKDLVELLTALASLPGLSELMSSNVFWLAAGIVLARWYNHQPPASTK